MPAPRVLFVKLSSLGDVVHHFPAVTDLRRHRPDVEIEWAVEEAYAPLVLLHPAVGKAIAFSLRQLRAGVLSVDRWKALGRARRELRAAPYDWIVDAQGLLKSVAVARLGRGALFGFGRGSARERSAAGFYDVGFAIPRNLHAVERSRQLVGAVFGYVPSGPAEYGIVPPREAPSWAPESDFIVALHASSRHEKRWPDDNWTALASRLARESITIVYPGGSDTERAQAARLAAASPNALAAPAMSLTQAASLLAASSATVGVDTGLTHLAAALGAPTVGLYVATKPGLTGLHGGDRVVNLGGPGQVPSVEEVARVLFGPTEPT